jgi:hypothetical protein
MGARIRNQEIRLDERRAPTNKALPEPDFRLSSDNWTRVWESNLSAISVSPDSCPSSWPAGTSLGTHGTSLGRHVPGDTQHSRAPGDSHLPRALGTHNIPWAPGTHNIPGSVPGEERSWGHTPTLGPGDTQHSRESLGPGDTQHSAARPWGGTSLAPLGTYNIPGSTTFPGPWGHTPTLGPGTTPRGHTVDCGPPRGHGDLTRVENWRCKISRQKKSTNFYSGRHTGDTHDTPAGRTHRGHTRHPGG